MENNIKKPISFWSFLKETKINETAEKEIEKIKIPIIQRDYAQGRLGREYVRKNFLENLKKALDGQPIKLDFVYGSIEDGKNLQPLDGQQRLTTLWLLHWYIALKSGNLTAENCGILNKFTYETRASSREFCENLCNPKNFELFEGTDVVKYIKNQTWFYSTWEQDPTIQSMLRMLSGTGKDDGIEPLFKDENFGEIFGKLTGDNAPITFYHLPLNNFGLSDDLYVKMNARGKQLTNFENFKADLVGYVREKAKGEKDWEPLLDAQTGIPIKMDTAWTDIFWKNRSKDNRIDEIYFAFLNRFFLNYKIKDIEKTTDEYYTYLTDKGNKERGDVGIQYSSIDRYKWDGKEIEEQLFRNLRDILDRYSNFKGEIPVATWVKDFNFIPKYTDSGITTLNLSTRAVFYAVCKYFEEGEADEESLNKWMRFVWNIVSAKSIDSLDDLHNAIKCIDHVESPHKAYDMVDFTVKNNSNAFERQLKEECIKAKKILEDKDNMWEKKFKNAEKYAFFHGSIRFLYQGPDGQEDWNNFDKKWKNLKKYFAEKEPEKEEMSCLKEGNSSDLLKVFFSYIETVPDKDFDNEHHIFREINEINNFKRVWRKILLNNTYQPAINHLLLAHEKKTCTPPKYNENALYISNVIYLLSQTELLDHLLEEFYSVEIKRYSFYERKKSEYIIKATGKNIRKNHEYQNNFILLNTQMAAFFEDEEIKKQIRIRKVGEAQNIKNSNFYLGLPSVYFEFNHQNYNWNIHSWREDRIYLLKNSDNYQEGIKKDPTSKDSPWIDFLTRKETGENLTSYEIIDELIKLRNDNEDAIREQS